MNKSLQETIPSKLLLLLQQGLPIEPRPLSTIARQLDITENEVVELTKKLFDEGKARRFGAVFDSDALGYKGTLCGVSVPASELQQCADIVSSHSGVTHCYEREGMPNLWFTLTALEERLDDELQVMTEKLAPHELLNLPATRKFKIQVVFDVSAVGGQQSSPAAPTPAIAQSARCHIGEQEKALIRLMQGNIPVSEDPFAWMASQLGLTTDETLHLIKTMKDSGAIRRICVILRHRAIGFVANGMCVWKVDPEEAEQAGQRLATCSEVTHCYERICYPSFPFNLFAMIHSDSREGAKAVLKKISTEAGLPEGHILFSVREFKKSSMIYFSEHSKG